MKLPLQAFGEILSALHRPSPAGGSAERRHTTRMEIECPLAVQLVSSTGSGQSIQVLTRDISQTGVGFLAGVELAVGGRLILTLPRSQGAPLRVLSEVKVSRKLADGIWFVGVEFEQQQLAEGHGKTRDEAQRVQRVILFGS